MLLPEYQVNLLSEKLARIQQQSVKYFSFGNAEALRSFRFDVGVTSFNPELATELQTLGDLGWNYLPVQETINKPTVYIITAHGADLTDEIWTFRSRLHPDSLICLWHFDNHIAHMANFKSALAADLNFLSHWLGADSYMKNCFSPVVSHVPLCTVQFSSNELCSYPTQLQDEIRIDKALFNYIMYEGAFRTPLIRQYQESMEDIADFMLMPSNDRGRYWSLTRLERYREWFQYKTTVMLPMVNDLSTRLYDALAAGMIPVVPSWIEDINIAIPEDVQKSLGIVKINSYGIEDVRAGIQQALKIYNESGEEGIRARINYVINNGMLHHRIGSILGDVDKLLVGKTRLAFGQSPNGVGMFVVQ